MTRAFAAVVFAAMALWTGVMPALAQHPDHEHEQATPATTGQNAESAGTEGLQSAGELPPFIPPVTEEDRKAAFPDVSGHAAHDNAINYFVLFDQLEWQSTAGGSGPNVDTRGWIGRDRDRVWFRAEGDGEDGRLGDAEAHVFYGRQFSRWWDVVAGIRHDFHPGPSRTWAAIGIQGLAPYWFEVELTGYIGESGRTQLRGEIEYELPLTNRLVLQPLLEVELSGKSDPERGIGAGLSTTDAGLRLRYEFRREIAPYIGVTWSNAWGKTADLAEAAGEDSGGARFVTGVRLWL